MSNFESKTRPGLDISEQTKVRLPLIAWLALLGSVSTAAAGYYGMRSEVARNSTDIIELKAEARATRELLIRIDTNVAALKEGRR